ncbi:EndoU domain-containing protein [Ileibacterium valens]|uniref:EndoU domain-containing protein n=1 Tax=Ileibacterium valens TaxID=1862668 RepID=UPI0035144AB2
MGTTMSGRYMNTQGSGRTVSDFALVHSNEGDFSFPEGREKKRRKKVGEKLIRLKNGGHGQTGMNLLDKYGIKYVINKTYKNGVRIGIIPDHVNPRKRRNNGQSWFPSTWTQKDIRRAAQHVAGLKSNRKVPDGRQISGVYKGVRVIVIRTHGKIATVFPDTDQRSISRRKKK